MPLEADQIDDCEDAQTLYIYSMSELEDEVKKQDEVVGIEVSVP